MTRITFSAVLIGVFIFTAGQDKPLWVSQLEVLLQKEESEWTISNKHVQSTKGHFHEVIILTAKRFTKYVVDLMPPSNKRLQPTPRQHGSQDPSLSR